MSDVPDHWEVLQIIDERNKLREALTFIAVHHHATDTACKHDPSGRDFRGCPCMTCKVASDALAYWGGS